MTAAAPVCGRCLLRVANVRAAARYAAPIPPTPAPCSLCLGILQEPALSAVLARVPPLLAGRVHDSRVKLTAALPPSAALVRARAFLLHARAPPAHVSLREAVKWTLAPRLAAAHGLVYAPAAELFLDLSFAHPASDPDVARFLPPPPPASAKRPRLDPAAAPSTAAATRAIDTLSDHAFRDAAAPALLPPPPVASPATVHVAVSVAPVLLAGAYNKLSRSVSQTPWFVDAPRNAARRPSPAPDLDEHARTRRTALSVEDVATAGIRAVLRPEKATFTAGGREDVDVRMLGSGRPFVVEVVSPRVIPRLITPEMVSEMARVSAAESRAVVLRDLRVVSKDYFAQMRFFESEKRKCYRCVVWTSRECALQQLKDRLEVPGGFLLKQKTPLRVLHRRTQAVRERHIYQANVPRVVSPNVFVLDVVAAAGTYIKEFVHGDNGRTVPNVAKLLGCDADILQLDVTDIHKTSTTGNGQTKTTSS